MSWARLYSRIRRGDRRLAKLSKGHRIKSDAEDGDPSSSAFPQLSALG